jgi:hypothetical protein
MNVQATKTSGGFRSLTAEEIDFVSGGTGVIIVTGTRIKANVATGGGGFLAYLEQGYDGNDNPTLQPNNGEGGEYMDPPKDTPCVEEKPDGVDLLEINTAALLASNAIAARNDETYEYGVIIYEVNGQIGWTQPFTQQSETNIDWNGGIPMVPDGARIIGIVHNHPDVGSIDDRYPSYDIFQNDDWDAYDALRDWGGTRGITVDSKMLMYIYTNQDHTTRVYDKTDKGDTHPSCPLQDPS